MEIAKWIRRTALLAGFSTALAPSRAQETKDLELSHKILDSNRFALGVLTYFRSTGYDSYSWMFSWTPLWPLSERLSLCPEVGMAILKEDSGANFLAFEFLEGLRFQATEALSLQLAAGFQAWMHATGRFPLVALASQYRFTKPWKNSFESVGLSYSALWPRKGPEPGLIHQIKLSTQFRF